MASPTSRRVWHEFRLPLVIVACVGAWLVLARACSHPALRSLTLAGNVPDLTEGND